jgi:hypothetical protein
MLAHGDVAAGAPNRPETLGAISDCNRLDLALPFRLDRNAEWREIRFQQRDGHIAARLFGLGLSGRA